MATWRSGGPSVVAEAELETGDGLELSSTALMAKWYSVEKSRPVTVDGLGGSAGLRLGVDGHRRGGVPVGLGQDRARADAHEVFHRLPDRPIVAGGSERQRHEVAVGHGREVGDGSGRVVLGHDEALDLIGAGGRGALVRAEAEAAPRESGPQEFRVGAPVERLVRGEDGVAAIDEAGVAGLEFEARRDEGHHHLVARRAAGVVEVGVEAIGVDHVPRRLPQDRGPHQPDAVRSREAVDEAVRVGVAVGQAVDGEIGRVGRPVRRPLVGRRADAAAILVLPEEVVPDGAAHLARVARLRRHHEAEEVAPPLAHLLGVAEAPRVRGATRQTSRDPVAILVDHDRVVERAVDGGRRVAADVHLHPRPAAVGRRREVGIRVAGAGLVADVGAALALRVHRVAVRAAAAVVVRLEIAAGLVEAVLVHHVVDDVAPVEEVDHGGVFVRQRPLRQVEREVEREAGAAVGLAVRVGPLVVVAVEVGVGVVAARDGELGASGAVRVVPAEGRGRRVLLARDHDAGVAGRQGRAVEGALAGSGIDAVRGPSGVRAEGLRHAGGVRHHRRGARGLWRGEALGAAALGVG